MANTATALLDATAAPLVVALALTALSGCRAESRWVDWQILFSEEGLRSRAVAVEATLRSGGCAGEELLYSAELIPGTEAPRPPPLEPGRYGFAARARDEGCQWFAAACEELELPEQGPMVTVSLVAIAPEPACSPGDCIAGFCRGSEEDADIDDADIDDADIDDADIDDAEPDIDAEPDADEAEPDADEPDAEVADSDPDDPCGGGCLDCEVCRGGACEVDDDGAACDGGFCLAGACCTAALEGGVTFVDEVSACFQRDSSWWWDVAAGFEGHRYYTWANANPAPDTIGWWTFAVRRAGTYRVEAYLPGTADSSRRAAYVIRGGTGPTTSTPIDQSAQSGWVAIGSFAMTVHDRHTVSLADNTGEDRALDRKLAYDALRFTFEHD